MGDFPINGDWAYAHSARWLLDEHRIRLSDSIAMNLLPQTLLGAGTSALFGFDRYLLFVLPFALAMVARCWPEQTGMVRIASAMWVALALILGVAATRDHDYSAWNRARWGAIHAAERLGATPETLDGGVEYNACYRFEIKLRVTGAGKSWWWIVDDRYLVAFFVPLGFVERSRFNVDRWLVRTPPAIFLLERAGTPSDSFRFRSDRVFFRPGRYLVAAPSVMVRGAT